MSSGQSIADQHELLKQQKALTISINATIKNAGRLNKRQRTVAAYRGRLKKLQASWSTFQNNHSLLKQHATVIQDEYFENDIHKITEAMYRQAFEYLTQMLTASMQIGEQQQSAMNAAAEQQRSLRREARPVWDGYLEWNTPIDTKSTDVQMLRKVLCQVSVNFSNGKPDIRTEYWPRKLSVRFMSKQQNKGIVKTYIKNSTTVCLDLGKHPANTNWKSLQTAALYGMVPFTFIPSPTTDDLKLLILLYSESDEGFVGYIPNEQSLVLDHLWKYFHQDETMQVFMQQSRAGIMPSNPALAAKPKPGILQDVILTYPKSVTIIRRSNANGLEIRENNLSVAGPQEVEHTTVNDFSDSSIFPNPQIRKPQEDGMMPKKRSRDDTIEMARKRNALEIRQLRQSLDFQPAVGDHPRSAVEDVETTQTLMRQIQSVLSDATEAPTLTTYTPQTEIPVSETNCEAMAAGQDSDIEEDDDIFIIEPQEEQIQSADLMIQRAILSTNSLQDEIVTSRRNSTAIDDEDSSEIEDNEVSIIEPEEMDHKHNTSELQMHNSLTENQSSPGTNVETARKLNQLQIKALFEALESAQEKAAELQQALETKQQEITDIRQSLESARKQEELYKRHERKSVIN